MYHSEMYLFGENDKPCALCKSDPKTNRELQFFQTYISTDENNWLFQETIRSLGIEDNTNPKVMCESCYLKMEKMVKMLETTGEPRSNRQLREEMDPNDSNSEVES